MEKIESSAQENSYITNLPLLLPFAAMQVCYWVTRTYPYVFGNIVENHIGNSGISSLVGVAAGLIAGTERNVGKSAEVYWSTRLWGFLIIAVINIIAETAKHIELLPNGNPEWGGDVLMGLIAYWVGVLASEYITRMPMMQPREE